MNYSESQKILEEIKKAKRILVNLHRGPDLDSFASAFSFYYFLCSLGKEIDVVVTANSELSSDILAFPEAKLIKQVDFSKFDFSKYDLLITCDSSSWSQIVDNDEEKIADMPIVVIDHHDSNKRFGKINLVKPHAVSCSQMIYQLFEDWDYEIDKNVAQILLTGIIFDSGAFQFSNDTEVMIVAAKLINKGADKEGIIKRFLRTKKFEEVKLWGEYLVGLQFDKKYKFIWTAVDYEKYKRFGSIPKVSNSVATQFASIVEGSEFGIILTEDEEKVLKISLRSRGKVDVSKLALRLNGGGHKMAAGGMIKGLPFEKAVEKVLETARKYAKEN